MTPPLQKNSTITQIGLFPLNLKMRQPFVTALGRKRVSHNVLVVMRLADGTTGFGEASASLAWETIGTHPTAVSALECALIDACARYKKIPLWRWFGKEARPVVTDLTLSAWPHAQAARLARAAYRAGFRILKVKGVHPRFISCHSRASGNRSSLSRG